MLSRQSIVIHTFQGSNLSTARKHLQGKHGLVRAEQGREEGGRYKKPKYLTLCPTNWPYTHKSTSSCKPCDSITGLRSVLGQREHESPCVCSFCWTYLPTRAELISHISQGRCRSNETSAHKLALLKRLFADCLAIPGAPALANAAAEERRAHAVAERAARVEKWR